MSNSTEDLSSFFFSTVTVAPDSTAAPSDVFFVPAQVQSESSLFRQHLLPLSFLTDICLHTDTEFNIQPWSISSTNEALATEPQTEFNLGLNAQVGDGFGFNTYSINLFGNENDVDSAGQVEAQPYNLSTQSTCKSNSRPIWRSHIYKSIGSNFGQDTNAIPDSNVNAFSATPLVNQTNVNTAGQVDIQQLFQIGQSVGKPGVFLALQLDTD